MLYSVCHKRLAAWGGGGGGFFLLLFRMWHQALPVLIIFSQLKERVHQLTDQIHFYNPIKAHVYSKWGEISNLKLGS